MSHLFCNTLVHVIYSRVSGQCSQTIFTGYFWCFIFILYTALNFG